MIAESQHFPKISVITPSYNCKDFIANTIESVLNQQYPNLEYIVIDGGSSDGTAEIIRQYSDQLTYWQSQKDGGQYDAINQGFSKSSGEIMCWLNADDMFLPNSLFVVSEIFSQLNNIEWISSLQPASWDACGYLAHIASLPGFSRQAFLDGLYLPTTTKKGFWLQQESTFWRRSLWEKAGSSIPNFHLAGDFALWCKFYEFAELTGVTYPLGGFRMISGQRSEDFEGYLKEAKAALDAARIELKWSANETSQFIYSAIRSIPKIQRLLKENYGYTGSYIHKQDMKSTNSSWSIEQKKFLP